MANLEEVPLGGCSFTWCHKSASKMSKLDRFLMSESLLSECPNLSAITLDRFLSDQRPILLRESTHDYGPIPFHFFHYWLEMEGFENFVNEVWREAPELADLEIIIDKGDAPSDTLHKRAEVVKLIQDVDKLWVLVEGDWVENPNMVKNEFLNHLNMEFPHHLNLMQQLDLEAEVSNEEIKKGFGIVVLINL
ncbi:hypothetical protein Tco_1189428 [Tanacetum coccineum]